MEWEPCADVSDFAGSSRTCAWTSTFCAKMKWPVTSGSSTLATGEDVEISHHAGQNSYPVVRT